MSIRTKQDRVLRLARAAYRAKPGRMIHENFLDGVVWTWKGGDIALVGSAWVGDMHLRQRKGLLPWDLQWLAFDPHKIAWYVKRVRDLEI